MPELPEVEVVRRQLVFGILHQPIASVSATYPKIIKHNPELLSVLPGHVFVDIERVGKLLVFRTGSPDVNVLCHLKMTGQLLFVGSNGMIGGGHTLSASDVGVPHKHTHVTVDFADGSKLYFNDMRKFGYFYLATADMVNQAMDRYGVEPISPEFSVQLLADTLHNRQATVKAVLLDQAKIAGLGNIYVDEACFRAGVRPDRRAGAVDSLELERLALACREVLHESIAMGGTTFYSFRDGNNQRGNYSRKLQVFQRQGQPCLVCGATIEKTKVAGRGTHYCPSCQK